MVACTGNSNAGDGDRRILNVYWTASAANHRAPGSVKPSLRVQGNQGTYLIETTNPVYAPSNAHVHIHEHIYIPHTYQTHPQGQTQTTVCVLLGAGNTIKNKELPVRENGDLNKIRGSRV